MDQTRAVDAETSAIAGFRAAMAVGDPIAFNTMGLTDERGDGTDKDVAKAGDLVLGMPHG